MRGRRRTTACRCVGTPGWDKFCLLYAHTERKRGEYIRARLMHVYTTTPFIFQGCIAAPASTELFERNFNTFYLCLKKKDSSAVSQSSEPDRNNIKASGNKSRHLDSGQPLGTALGEITEGGEREGWSGINGILYILFS